jgi:NADPH-dependent 2,4-dienoyl-CoA reductase/sulfur reductase-like enzyme
MHLNRTVKSVNPAAKSVADDSGATHTYESLLLATGGVVRRFPWNVEGVVYFRTLNDYRKLREVSEKGKRIAVIGGGFIGSEIAAALAMNGVSVTMIFPDSGIGVRIYPPGLSRFLATYYHSKGVEVLANEGVVGIESRGDSFMVKTKLGKQLNFDAVVAGIGIEPNVALAKSAGLKVDNGIVVDEFTATSSPGIYAAGDVANFFNPALGKRIRVEHEDNANSMGAVAGKNMAGGRESYRHLPFFYSDLFDLGYEAVGDTDARMEMVEDWKVQYREGVVYYLSEGRVRGVLLWNTWGQVDNARSLIAEAGPFTAASVKGRLPA